MKAIGLEVAECHAVTVTGAFAQQLTNVYGFIDPVRAGRHWGTTFWGGDVQEIEFHESNVSVLKRPTDLFCLYLGDLIIGTPDRKVHGNVLLKKSDSEKLTLIPIDHSDSFRHPSCLRDPACLESSVTERIASWLPGTEGVVLDQPANFVLDEVRRIQALEAQILAAVSFPHDEWYEAASVNPENVKTFLATRVRNLEGLADVQYWNGLRDATGGGLVLGI